MFLRKSYQFSCLSAIQFKSTDSPFTESPKESEEMSGFQGTGKLTERKIRLTLSYVLLCRVFR